VNRKKVRIFAQIIHISMSNDPLHGVTLEKIVTDLVEALGWEEMEYRVRVNCFAVNPSVKSSLTFLRKTPWARKKVEDLWVREIYGRR
jgi:uncharacterized protein (DUF2132 family)